MIIRKIILLRSASRYWTIISPTTQKQRWFVLVGSTTGKQHYLNFSVVPNISAPTMVCCKQLQLLSRVDPTTDCYLGAYSTISISIPHTHTQIHHISYQKQMEIHFKAAAPPFPKTTYRKPYRRETTRICSRKSIAIVDMGK